MAIDVFIIKDVFAKSGTVLGVISTVMAIIHLFIYASLAISNPGILTQFNMDTEEEEG